jgi:hypothetical protein
MKTVIPLLILLSGTFGVNLAEEPKSTPADPKTKLEGFQAKSGAVIIRGFSEVGSIEGRSNTSIDVDCIFGCWMQFRALHRRP